VTSQENKSTGDGGPSVGAAVGGAIGAVVLVCIVAYLAIHWNAKRTSSSPVQEHKDHSSTESETGRNVETGYQHQADVAAQPSTPTTPSTQGELVSAGNTVATAHSSSQRSPTGSARRPVQFKDQARTVIDEDVPLVAGYAASGSSQQLPQQEPELVVAQPLDVRFIANADTGSSRRSDPDGRRADP
jgi:predicted lipid-binding transport protein (Tim44 family)